MIRLSVFYPAPKEGQTFNLEYFTKTHVPLAGKLLEPVRCEIDKGLSGAGPGSPAPFGVTGHFYFETLEHFGSRMGVHGGTIQADVANYTNIEPIIQISEILKLD